MLGQLVAAFACSLALTAPCASTHAQATFRPYASGFSDLTAIVSTPVEPRRLYYTDVNGNTRVVEYRSRSGKAIPSSARQILFVAQPFANHNGGELQFGADKRRYYFGDWCSGTIWSLRMNNGNAEARREPGSIGRVSTLGVDNDGELYAGTSGGRVYKLTP